MLTIITPLRWSAWALCLAAHPDRLFVQYILDGIAQGFRVGFSYNSHCCVSATSNHPSANDHPEVISRCLQTEVEKGRLIGPLDPTQFPYIHTSSLGAVPPKTQ